MVRWILQKSKVITLLCYGVYALSPIYAAFPSSNGVKDPNNSHHTVVFGILWLDVLFDSIVDGDLPDGTASNGPLLQASQDEDIVLIKKKRAVNNRYFYARPLLKEHVCASCESEPPVPILYAYQIPCDMMHLHAKGHSPLNTGLSPPFSIS